MTIGLKSEGGMLAVHEDVGGPHNGAEVVRGGLDEGDSPNQVVEGYFLKDFHIIVLIWTLFSIFYII